MKGRAVGCNTLDWKVIGASNEGYILDKTVYDYYPKAIADTLQNDIDKVLQTGKNSQMEDVIIDITTGKLKYFSATRAPLRNKRGEIIGVVGTSIEITKEKEAQKSTFDQILVEKETLRTEMEHFRFENELRILENEILFAEKESQARVTKFVNKMLHEIQVFRLEELHQNTGIKLPISDKDRHIKLTKREQQILYFLSLNKSPKDMCAVAKLH